MDDLQTFNIPGPGGFIFSAAKIEELGATEYTLATLVLDVSGSVRRYKDSLKECITTVIDACKKNPRAENLLFRIVVFNKNVKELMGFKEVNSIRASDIQDIDPMGTTALFDGVYSSVTATIEYAEKLYDQDFDCNACIFIVTDGMDNESTMTPSSIKDQIEKIRQDEKLENCQTVLIRVTSPDDPYGGEVEQSLDRFQKQAKLDAFINLKDASPETLAKIANFVSQSISSQSQALANGSPSQLLNF
jgi:uncharacterized protein YegL